MTHVVNIRIKGKENIIVTSYSYETNGRNERCWLVTHPSEFIPIIRMKEVVFQQQWVHVASGSKKKKKNFHRVAASEFF